MKKLYIILTIVVVMLGFISYYSATSAQEIQSKKFKKVNKPIKDNYIVVIKEDSDVDTLTDVFGRKVKHKYKSAIKGLSVHLTEEEAKQLSEDPRVEFVEEDAEIKPADTQTNPDWGIDRIDQRNLPLDSSFTYNASGLGVNAYIIDSGIYYAHSDFVGRASLAYDIVGDGQNGNDCYGHGTHVAGIVGSNTYGVAKNVQLKSVRVLNCAAQGSVSGLLNALDWLNVNGIKPAVVNISLDAGGVVSALDSAIVNTINNGFIVVVAAANSNIDACNTSPARVTQGITVGATTISDQRAAYSNYGSCVFINAGGTGITSLGITDPFATRVMSGTSMASPMVAGAAALYLQTVPYANEQMVKQALDASSTKNVITGLPTGTPNKLVFLTYGTGTEPVPTPVPTPTPKKTPKGRNNR